MHDATVREIKIMIGMACDAHGTPYYGHNTTEMHPCATVKNTFRWTYLANSCFTGFFHSFHSGSSGEVANDLNVNVFKANMAHSFDSKSHM